MIPATLVDGKELLDTVLYSVVAGVGLTLVFSLAVWGVTRFAELSRDERHLAAGGAAALAVSRWSRRSAPWFSGSSS